MSADVDPCPLCAARNAQPVWSVSYDQIWDRYEVDFSATFPDDLVADLSPRRETTLYDCLECGLGYFSPIAPGTAHFYRELMGQVRYIEGRWEFGVVGDLIGVGEEVLDFGAGSGLFLSSISDRAGRAVGVDHNADAVAQLRQAGLEGYATDFETFSRSHRGCFDVVCAFQSLEHLPSVHALAGAARQCARSGGRIFVSVPNRDRWHRAPLEPFDCPPHHISRWRGEQLVRLADLMEVDVISIRHEEPDLSEARRWYRRRAEVRLRAAESDRWRAVLARTYAKLASGPRRHERRVAHGHFTRREIYGHGLLAEFRVP